MRDGWRRIAQRPMARRMAPEDRPPRRPRRAVLAGWLAAAAAIALLAFIVGRPGPAGSTPTPTPADAPPRISFGTERDPVTGEAREPTDRFRAGEMFVYSLTPAEPVEADEITLEILRVEGDDLVSHQVAEIAAGSVIGRAVPVDDMIDFYGPGEFVMRIYLDPASPLGEGRFTLLDSPEAS